MPQLVVGEEFHSPADRLWALLRDFGNPVAWRPPDSSIKDIGVATDRERAVEKTLHFGFSQVE